MSKSDVSGSPVAQRMFKKSSESRDSFCGGATTEPAAAAGAAPASTAVLLSPTWAGTYVGNARTIAAASLMQPTIVSEMYTRTLICLPDFIPCEAPWSKWQWRPTRGVNELPSTAKP